MKPAFAVALLLATLVSTAAMAREVEGVQIPDTLTLAGEKQPLVLNGAGVRTKFLVKVYVGALYMQQPVTRADTVLNATTARSMRLHFVRAVSADKLADGWRSGFADNQSGFEMQALQGRLGQFGLLMRDVQANDVLRIDLLPRGETRVSFNDQLRGSVDGADFQQALLRVWIGAKPADNDMKQALLGGKK